MNDMPLECPREWEVSYPLWNIQLWVHKATDGCLGFNIYQLNIYHYKLHSCGPSDAAVKLLKNDTLLLWN